MSLVLVARSSDNSVEVALEDSPVPEKPLLTDADLARYEAYTTELGSKIKAAFARGKAAAEKDIKAGRFRLRAFGKPADKNETDSITGYPIERIGPRNQSNPIFSDIEVNGYNSETGTRSTESGSYLTHRCNQPLFGIVFTMSILVGMIQRNATCARRSGSKEVSCNAPD